MGQLARDVVLEKQRPRPGGVPVVGSVQAHGPEGGCEAQPDARRQERVRGDPLVSAVGYRPSRVRRRMPRRFWMARSSSPSFLPAQMNTQTAAATVRMLTAVITIPRNVLIAATVAL